MRTIVNILLLLQFSLFSNVLSAESLPRFVAIVIDDLGNDLVIGERLVALPHALTYSFLPHTKYSATLVKLAQTQHREVMLHMPMQAVSNKAMGPGGLSMAMARQEFVATIKENIRAIPSAIGVNNHMGSLLTQNSTKMKWLMQELKQMELTQNKNLYFLDSRTHAASIAEVQAKAYRIPTAKRDIFLDHVVEGAEIDHQFQRLLDRVNSVGYALAIGHPHHETLEALKKWLPKLTAKGIEIVTVSRYITLTERKNAMWQASLSRSNKVVKN